MLDADTAATISLWLYVVWVPLAAIAFRDLRGRRPAVRAAVPIAILVAWPAGLLLWLLFREVWTGGPGR